MKHILPVVLAIGATLSSSASLPGGDLLLSADDVGYLARGRRMLESANYAGTIDQLGRISTEAVPLSAEQSEEWLYLLASAYFHTGDTRCEEMLNAFIDSYPASARGVEATLMLGDFYLYAHKYPEALEIYNRLPLNALGGPMGDKYTYRRAFAMVKCGYYDEARPLFRALSSKSEYANAATYYDAYIDYVQGRSAEALRKFERVRPDADGICPQYYICQLIFGAGEWQSTIQSGERLLSENADSDIIPGTQRVIGLSYYELGDYAKARPYLEEYVRYAGDSAADDAKYALGACLYEAGRYDEAQSLFSSLTDLRDAIAQGSYLYLGQIAAAQGNPSSASINFEKAYRMNFDPKVAETALYNYVSARMRGGNVPFDNSMDLLQQFAALYPDSEYSPAVDKTLAEFYYSRGEYDKALESINRIRRPDASALVVRALVLYGAGTSAVTRGEYRRGAELLDECVRIAGSNSDLAAQAYMWLGDARYGLEQYSASGNAYSSALKAGLTDRTRSLARYDLGYALLMQNKFSAAAREFEDVVQARTTSRLPEDIITDARLRLADCKYYLGDYSGALSMFQTLKGEGQSADYTTLRQAQIIGVRGDISGKIKLLEDFERQYPDSRWMSEALEELAETYTAESRHDKAAGVYERLVTRYPERETGRRLGETYYQLGNQLLSQGDRKGALEAFRKLEKTGTAELVAEAYVGIMRSTDNADEQLRYARMAKRSGGLDTESVEEATYIEAKALLDSHSGTARAEGEEILRGLALNPQTLNGSKAAVALGEYLLASGHVTEAIDNMEE
ncbi:MAG: tetratricopeptide repeat protein, partial [Muribaculaceae bacterium]|nr:tetratricopeptide repeat protein [Muribaculaceae bacterium]